MAQKKMILDLDTGIDDAMAIAYAVADPDVDLIGIIGSYGNVYVEDGVQNSLKILELLGATDVPVYQGLSHSSESDHFDRMPVSAQFTAKTASVMFNFPIQNDNRKQAMQSTSSLMRLRNMVRT